jgi:hypothetical protein
MTAVMTESMLMMEGRTLAAAILTRRLRKCIAEGAHQTKDQGACPRCGQ